MRHINWGLVALVWADLAVIIWGFMYVATRGPFE